MPERQIRLRSSNGIRFARRFRRDASGVYRIDTRGSMLALRLLAIGAAFLGIAIWYEFTRTPVGSVKLTLIFLGIATVIALLGLVSLSCYQQLSVDESNRVVTWRRRVVVWAKGQHGLLTDLVAVRAVVRSGDAPGQMGYGLVLHDETQMMLVCSFPTPEEVDAYIRDLPPGTPQPGEADSINVSLSFWPF